MKIIFFGLGSIGNRHARLIQENFSHQISAYRRRRDGETNPLGISEVFSWEDVSGLRPDIAFITNPTAFHVETAYRCADLGMHIFMEKPLGDRWEGIEALEVKCRQKGLTFYTAYCLRFHPVIKKFRELLQDKEIYHGRVVCSSYLPLWRQGRDHRQNYSAIAKLGGGALLDLSHEFDYLVYLLGPIKTIQGKVGRAADVTIDADDFVDAIVATEKGVVVNVHLNFLSLLNERTIKIDFKDGYLAGDLYKSTLTYCFNGKTEEFQFNPDRDAFFKEQLAYFLSHVGQIEIMNNISEAKHLFKKILEFKNGSG